MELKLISESGELLETIEIPDELADQIDEAVGLPKIREELWQKFVMEAIKNYLKGK